MLCSYAIMQGPAQDVSGENAQLSCDGCSVAFFSAAISLNIS